MARTAARLDEDDVGVVLGRHLLAGCQVRADVLPDRRVRAAPRLDRLDALRLQRRVL